jgi:hypothetical protein
MGPQTKKKALEKLTSLNTKIGYPDKSYKRECQETTLSVGSVPILFCLGIQPNWLNVHPQSESGLPQAEYPVASPRAKRRYAFSPLWFHTLVAAPFVF